MKMRQKIKEMNDLVILSILKSRKLLMYQLYIIIQMLELSSTKLIMLFLVIFHGVHPAQHHSFK